MDGNSEDLIDFVTESDSPIVQFYHKKCIFLTGATGFLGKLVLDKLLRCCDIEKIFILIRHKKGKDVQTRVDELLNDIVFEPLRKEKPDFQQKVFGIYGECGVKKLGLSESDRIQLIEKTNVIIHLAATVNFDEKLRIAMAINVSGTADILNLCKEMNNLKAFVYVSTAYSNCSRTDIDETFYEPRFEADKALQLMECLDDATLERITPELLQKWPNTYSFTKSLAENYIKMHSEGLPVTVFRPAMVVTTYRDPIPGWINNLYGPNGMAAGIAVGLLRVGRIKGDNPNHIVPADFCINGILTSAWDVAKNTYTEPPIYNLALSDHNPITYEKYIELGFKHGMKIPTSQAFWYYTFTLTASPIMYNILMFLYHIVPAFVMDMMLVFMGKKKKNDANVPKGT